MLLNNLDHEVAEDPENFIVLWREWSSGKIEITLKKSSNPTKELR